MKSSRVLTICGIFAATMFFGTTLLGWVDASAADHVLPSTPYKFEPVSRNDQVQLWVDKETMFSRIDQDQDLQVGAVVRIVMNNGQDSKTLINAVVSICGHNGLLILKGRSYNSGGVLESQTDKPIPFQDLKPESRAGMIYRYLCSNAPQPTKLDSSYKAPERYNKFWS